MKNFLFIIFLIFLFPKISAQINEGAFDDFIYFINQNKAKYDGVEGTPYLTKDFVPALINDNKAVVYVRFNAFDKSIELKKPDGEIVILSQGEDYKFKLMDGSEKKYESHFFIDDTGKKSKTFFEKIHQTTNYTLFLKENIKLIPKKTATSGFEQNQPAKFAKDISTYYITNIFSDTPELITVPNRKKEVYKLFKDKSFQQSIKKQKLKFNKEEDLIKLFDLYFDKI